MSAPLETPGPGHPDPDSNVTRKKTGSSRDIEVQTRDLDIQIPIPSKTGTGRRRVILKALAQLPRGFTFDVVLEHEHDCESLEEWAEGELRFCSCSAITLRARQIR